MRRVFATDLGIWPMLMHMERASDTMLASPDYWTRVANYLLLYDQVVIPTGNFQILPVLRIMFGDDIVDELLRNREIVLVRYDQWLCYAGAGHGLQFYKMGNAPNTPSIPDIGMGFYQPLDQAIDNALLTTKPYSTPERRATLAKLLLDNVVPFDTATIEKQLFEEAYSDVLKSSHLRDFLSLKNSGRSLKSLCGIQTNQISIFSPHVPPGPLDSLEIRAVLRVAFENLIFRLGSHCQVTDITGDEETLSILRAKGQRLGFTTEGDAAFTQIQKVSGVPDLGAAFSGRQLSPAQLLDLRHSKHCQALRDWFSQGSPYEGADQTIKRYIETLGSPGWIDSIQSKILRFASTAALGAFSPVAGTLASVVDSFYLSDWFPVRSPRLFLRQAKVMLMNKPVIQNPVMNGRDRNLPCSCGSGKKFKKCCGR